MSWAWLAALGVCACSGVVETPEPDPVSRRRPTASDAGRGSSADPGAGGSRGGLDAGAGGRAGAPDVGGSGSGGSAGAEAPDGGSVVSAPPRQYCDAVSEVFRPSCGNGSCHTNQGATIGDFGAGPLEAAAYVGRGSVRDSDCGLIIDPIEPQDSLILTKVTGDYPADQNCGGRMPVGSFEVTDEQIDCISDWVEQFRN